MNVEATPNWKPSVDTTAPSGWSNSFIPDETDGVTPLTIRFFTRVAIQA